MGSSMENASGNLDCLAWRSAASVAVVKSPGNSEVRRRWVLGGWEGEKFGFTCEVDWELVDSSLTDGGWTGAGGGADATQVVPCW